jgi:hypothetical protein
MFEEITKMFGKTTKANPEKVFVAALDACLSQAKNAGVPSGVIRAHLGRRIEWNTPEWRHPSLPPKTFDSYGNPIDMAAEAQKAREARKKRADAACVIDPSQRQRAASGHRVR